MSKKMRSITKPRPGLMVLSLGDIRRIHQAPFEPQLEAELGRIILSVEKAS